MSGDDADDPVGHDDHLARRLAVEPAGHLGQFERGALDLAAFRIAGKFERTAQLAIDLDGDRHLLFSG